MPHLRCKTAAKCHTLQKTNHLSKPNPRKLYRWERENTLVHSVIQKLTDQDPKSIQTDDIVRILGYWEGLLTLRLSACET